MSLPKQAIFQAEFAVLNAQIRSIIFNTDASKKLVNFWSSFLGVAIAQESDSFVWLESGTSCVRLGFQIVSDSEVSSDALHFDVEVSDKDMALEQIESLGGNLIEKHAINFVVADPQGNKFCIYSH